MNVDDSILYMYNLADFLVHDQWYSINFSTVMYNTCKPYMQEKS